MIYLDIETLDFFQDPHIAALPRGDQIAAIRFGCAVTHDSVAETWREWLDADDLLRYLRHGRSSLCGWNIIDFDLPVIGNSAKSQSGPASIQAIDLFDLIRQATGRWYKLDVVAQENLGRQKLSHGQQATEWLRSGDPAQMAKALEYCREDVQLVVDLHQLLLDGEALRLPPRLARREENEILFSLDANGQPQAEWIVNAAGILSTR